MIEHPSPLAVGEYWLSFPKSAQITVDGGGTWRVVVGRFQFFLTLDAQRDLSDLKKFIDQQTRGNASTPSLVVNGIEGVMHGDYGPPRTWIDWWFKKGDATLCICLQSIEFPFAEPADDERSLHEAIIQSLEHTESG